MITVRPYVAADEAAVRSLCCDTGHAGQPIDLIFPDRDIFADHWTGYYTANEPESIWVADDGQVAGYIMGGFDERRQRRWMATTMVPQLIFKMISKALVFEPKIWSLVFGALCAKKPAQVERFFSEKFPSAHLHINLSPRLQRRGVGSDLIGKLEESARMRSIRMLKAETREDNTGAVQFFKRCGFQVMERRVGYKVRGQVFNVVVFGKELIA